MYIEMKRRGQFVTRVYGSAPAEGNQAVFEDFQRNKIYDAVYSYARAKLKKNEKIDMKSMQILKIFHREVKGQPVLGSWAIRRALLNTAGIIFNSKVNECHPLQKHIGIVIGPVTPYLIPFTRGKRLITKPDGVDTHTTSTKEGNKTKSFFTAYEYVEPGAVFELTLRFDNGKGGKIQPKAVEELLEYLPMIGFGAYRERFGKFEWIK